MVGALGFGSRHIKDASSSSLLTTPVRGTREDFLVSELRTGGRSQRLPAETHTTRPLCENAPEKKDCVFSRSKGTSEISSPS